MSLDSRILEKLDDGIFRYDPLAALAMQHYIDIIGFSRTRLFKIHAWQIPGGTENERDVALRIARIILEAIRKEELKASNQASEVTARKLAEPQR